MVHTIIIGHRLEIRAVLTLHIYYWEGKLNPVYSLEDVLNLKCFRG